MDRPLRFHWSLSQAGNALRRAQATTHQTGLLSLDAQLALCRRAEENGIESMLMAIGFTRPDPLLLSVVLGQQTERMKFMVACRSGLISPSYFVQQLNTASTLIEGRLCINMVCGHSPHELRYYGDNLPHDERYQRTDEFLSICRALWRREQAVDFNGQYYRVANARIDTPFRSPTEQVPEIFLGGHSAMAESLAIAHASCLWRFADTPDNLRPQVERLTQHGTEVGLLVALIARPTREEAQQAAQALIADFGEDVKAVHQNFAQQSDAVGFRSTYARANADAAWLTPYLWAGAVPYLGAPSIALVGSYADIADAIMDYKALGISQFLFLGWPDIEEVARFGKELLPLIRRCEQEAQAWN